MKDIEIKYIFKSSKITQASTKENVKFDFRSERFYDYTLNVINKNKCQACYQLPAKTQHTNLQSSSEFSLKHSNRGAPEHQDVHSSCSWKQANEDFPSSHVTWLVANEKPQSRDMTLFLANERPSHKSHDTLHVSVECFTSSAECSFTLLLHSKLHVECVRISQSFGATLPSTCG